MANEAEKPQADKAALQRAIRMLLRTQRTQRTRAERAEGRIDAALAELDSATPDLADRVRRALTEDQPS